MVKLFKGCLCSLIFFMASPLYAWVPQWESVRFPWYVGIGGEVSWFDFSSHTTVNNGTNVPAPFFLDRFSINDTDSTPVSLSFYVGYKWHLKGLFFPCWRLELQYSHRYQETIQGKIQQFSLPEFENYKYSVKSKADIFLVAAKVDLIRYNTLLPFFSFGIGAANNQVSAYSEVPLANVTPRITPAYRDHDNTRFAYSVGLGLDLDLSPCSWLTVGYNYLHQGKIRTGNGERTWSPTQLNLGEGGTHNLYAAIFYQLPLA